MMQMMMMKQDIGDDDDLYFIFILSLIILILIKFNCNNVYFSAWRFASLTVSHRQIETAESIVIRVDLNGIGRKINVISIIKIHK